MDDGRDDGCSCSRRLASHTTDSFFIQRPASPSVANPSIRSTLPSGRPPPLVHCSTSKTSSGSFHLRSAHGSTNNRLDPAAGAINLLAAIDLEAVGYAFEGRFQISAFTLFPCCRAVECALRARHRRNKPLAFRHAWPPCPMPDAVVVTPISENPCVTPAVMSALTRSLTIGTRPYS